MADFKNQMQKVTCSWSFGIFSKMYVLHVTIGAVLAFNVPLDVEVNPSSNVKFLRVQVIQNVWQCCPVMMWCMLVCKHSSYCHRLEAVKTQNVLCCSVLMWCTRTLEAWWSMCTECILYCHVSAGVASPVQTQNVCYVVLVLMWYTWTMLVLLRLGELLSMYTECMLCCF